MTLSIRNPVVEDRARRLAVRTGKSITAVVDQALAEYEARRALDERAAGFAELEVLFQQWDAIPDADPRTTAELLDDLYDEDGLPK